VSKTENIFISQAI